MLFYLLQGVDMAVREVIKMGHPTLRKVAVELSEKEILSDEIRQLVSDMYETMEKYEGIGIAAPQVNVSKSLAIVGIPTSDDEEDESENSRYPNTPKIKSYVVINPKITVLEDAKVGMWEGCLSVPGLRGYVERPSKVKIDFLDLNAKKQTIEAEGFLAIVFQHELDHLFGKLYIDRIEDTTKIAYNDTYDEFVLDNEDQESE